MRPKRFPVISWCVVCGMAAAAANGGDVSSTVTADPKCFNEGAEGTVRVVAKNTLGHTTDALVMAACAKFESENAAPAWIVEKTFQNANDPLKLPAVFPYVFNGQNCIRADPAGPGGSWPANTTETVTFTYRSPASVNSKTLVLHGTAWSQEQPVDKELKLPECGLAPHLKIEKFNDLIYGLFVGYYIVVTNDGTAPTVGDVIVTDRVPGKLKIARAFLTRGFGTPEVPITPSGSDGQTVKATITSSIPPKTLYVVHIWTDPKPGATGEILNSALVCGGGDTTAPCSNPRESNGVIHTLKAPTGPPPAAQISGPSTAAAGSPKTYSAATSNQVLSADASATAITYAWLLSDVPLLPAALGPTLIHTFAKPGPHKVSLVAFANGARTTTDLGVTVSAATPGCTPGANILCLLGGRFKVQVDWQSLNNSAAGIGAARPITADTGAFWFFDAANLELVVKVIDGRGLNGKFWVFFGALSDLQYQIKVTDTQTGEVRQYVNEQGNLTSAADTGAFPIATSALAGEDGESTLTETPPLFLEAQTADLATMPEPASSCIADQGTKKLCLSDRFDVSVTCSVPGGSCTPSPVKLTGDTGYFWFFNSANIELMTKVVDGRGLNGKFWFFYGALSDVQYSIRIKDRVTGAFKDYSNPQGHLGSVADTSALPGQ
jgi:uncharacterized repeat protein (TIGR01451 family)